MVRIKDRILDHRLKASSLIEVITALIIISTIFSLSILIYLNIQRAGFSVRKLTYSTILDEVYAGIADQPAPGNTEYTYEDDATVYQSITVHPANRALVMIHLEARSQEGKILSEKKYLRYVPVQR